MMSSPASQRLVQLFERELRDSSTVRLDAVVAPRRPRAVSRELERQVAEVAAQLRTIGSTPEQMLVDLKALLSCAAPEVASSERRELISSITGRAIDAFFGSSSGQKKA